MKDAALIGLEGDGSSVGLLALSDYWEERGDYSKSQSLRLKAGEVKRVEPLAGAIRGFVSNCGGEGNGWKRFLHERFIVYVGVRRKKFTIKIAFANGDSEHWGCEPFFLNRNMVGDVDYLDRRLRAIAFSAWEGFDRWVKKETWWATWVTSTADWRASTGG